MQTAPAFPKMLKVNRVSESGQRAFGTGADATILSIFGGVAGGWSGRLLGVDVYDTSE